MTCPSQAFPPSSSTSTGPLLRPSRTILVQSSTHAKDLAVLNSRWLTLRTRKLNADPSLSPSPWEGGKMMNGLTDGEWIARRVREWSEAEYDGNVNGWSERGTYLVSHYRPRSLPSLNLDAENRRKSQNSQNVARPSCSNTF